MSGPRPARRIRRLRDFPIAVKLGVVAALFAAISLALLLLLVAALNVAAGARSAVAAESLWSKGQKDAVFFLSRYLRSHDTSDFAAFEQSIALPLGDRQARLAMEQPQLDAALAARGFIAGGNPLADVPHMISLFRRARKLRYFAAAQEQWRSGEDQVLELVRLGDDIHRSVAAGGPAPPQAVEFQSAIDRVNLQAAPLEREFSVNLRQGVAAARSLLLGTVVGLAAALLGLGLLVSWRVGADLRGSIMRLRAGALSVMAGDPDAHIESGSRDELGELAAVFDEMVQKRRDAERALRAATEFSEAIMQNATDAIYVIDGEGRLSVINQRTCELTGYPRGQLLEMPWTLLIPREHAAWVNDIFETVLREGVTVTEQEVPMLRRDGSVRTASFSAAPLRRDGKIFAIVGSAADITERRRAEAALRTRAEELARANRELEQFAYVASHDLQDPLRTVATFAHLLGRRCQGRLDQEAEGFIDAIGDGVKRMQSLIEDLLAYARITFDSKDLELTSFDDIFADACASLRAAIAQTSAEVSCEPLPRLRVNRPQIRLLFENLIANALKFRGDQPPRVHIAVRALSSEWLISVRDNGIGIEPQHADRVFVLFQRLHDRTAYPGNGIGLTLCKKIVELHGGRIWVEPGNPGSVFKFTLKATADPAQRL
jgi:PAS domain S-box-containing protein